MIQTDQLIYTVSLRWKKAEYLAARNLDNEIKDATLVHGIFPPLKSRDVEKKTPPHTRRGYSGSSWPDFRVLG